MKKVILSIVSFITLFLNVNATIANFVTDSLKKNSKARNDSLILEDSDQTTSNYHMRYGVHASHCSHASHYSQLSCRSFVNGKEIKDNKRIDDIKRKISFESIFDDNILWTMHVGLKDGFITLADTIDVQKIYNRLKVKKPSDFIYVRVEGHSLKPTYSYESTTNFTNAYNKNIVEFIIPKKSSQKLSCVLINGKLNFMNKRYWMNELVELDKHGKISDITF